jgi:hypothetical protein
VPAASRTPPSAIAIPICPITLNSSRNDAGNGLLSCSVVWPAPIRASITPAARTPSSIARDRGSACVQEPFQKRFAGMTALKTTAAQATEITLRQDTTRSQRRPAIALGATPVMVATKVTAMTSATSGDVPSDGPRSMA